MADRKARNQRLVALVTCCALIFCCVTTPRFEQNSAILLKHPDYFKDDGRPKATAGLIPYARAPDGEVYVLLSRERADGTDPKVAGSYCEFGGSLEGSRAQPESFLDAVLREGREESAGLIDISAEAALEQGHVYFSDKPSRQVAEVFFEVSKFYTTEELHAAQKSATNPAFLEKDDFRWVRAKDLLDANVGLSNAFIWFDPWGKFASIRLRSFFKDMLKDEHFRMVLESIVY